MASMNEAGTAVVPAEPGAQPIDRSSTVLYVTPDLNRGETARTCLEFVIALRKAGWAVLVASPGGTLQHDVTRAGATHVHFATDSVGLFAGRRHGRELAALIDRHGVAIVHAFGRSAAVAAQHAAHAARIPWIASHLGAVTIEGWFERRRNGVIVQSARTIVASPPLGADLVRVFGVDAKQVRVVPPSVDITAFDWRRVHAERLIKLAGTWRLPDGAPVVMLLGPAGDANAYATGIEAVRRLDRKDLCLLMIEDAPLAERDQEAFNALVARHGFEGTVRSVGECRDLPAALKLADVVVAAAAAPEALLRSVAAAQAMGRPVVAPDRFGVDEIIVRGETGWIVPPGDAGALSSAMGEALSLTALQRAALGERAILRAQKVSSRERLAETLVGLYDEVISERRGSPAAAP
jgi:glycosyltransferase involved in cell wall biosynthesis